MESEPKRNWDVFERVLAARLLEHFELIDLPT
jgi:hypothetical protein